MKNSKSKLRKKLKSARLDANLTQQELADKLDVHVNFYARIERGERNPSIETLKKLTKILKVKSSDILPF